MPRQNDTPLSSWCLHCPIGAFIALFGASNPSPYTHPRQIINSLLKKTFPSSLPKSSLSSLNRTQSVQNTTVVV